MAIAEKSGVEKVTEKLAEKRRALGRGLESLLPGGPRAVPANDPTFAQNTRKEETSSEVLAPTTAEGEAAGTPVVGGAAGEGVAVGERVDLQAVAARKS